MTGKEIREYIISHGVRLWQVAAALDMRDVAFSVRLRSPFSDEECELIKSIVADIAKQNAAERSET